MYTSHTEGTEVLFVCDVCDAVLVSEQGMEEHLRTQHGEELLIMDIETIRQATEALRRNPDQEGEENQEAGEEEAGAPNIDMSWVDHQFFVCRICDDVFIDRKHLEVHINIRHDLNEFAEKEVDVNSEATPSQCPKPRRFKRKMVLDGDKDAREVTRVGLSQVQTPIKVIPPPLVTNTPITPPQEGHAMFVPPSDHNPVQVKKPKSYKGTKISRNGAEMEYQCPTCGDSKDTRSNFKNHLLTHYADIFNPLLPSASPYKCPKCDKQFRDKISLMRHYAFYHKKMYEMTDLTEESLKEIITKALVSKE